MKKEISLGFTESESLEVSEVNGPTFRIGSGPCHMTFRKLHLPIADQLTRHIGDTLAAPLKFSILTCSYNMLLEDQRFIHEDLERLEQAIADRVAEEPRNVSTKLWNCRL